MRHEYYLEKAEDEGLLVVGGELGRALEAAAVHPAHEQLRGLHDRLAQLRGVEMQQQRPRDRQAE